jgi:hypothetical protein
LVVHKLAFFIDFLLWGHIVGRDEAHSGATDGEDEGQAATCDGLSQGKIAELSMSELFLNDEGVVAVALLGLLGRHGERGGDGWRHPNRKALLANAPHACTCIVFTTFCYA